VGFEPTQAISSYCSKLGMNEAADPGM